MTESSSTYLYAAFMFGAASLTIAVMWSFDWKINPVWMLSGWALMEFMKYAWVKVEEINKNVKKEG